ncbi:RNA polymerase sigma factor [Formosa undariae]|uniref:RNA polymerase sigma factor n=1 Tax=Formosa undariae TaxID=1325436 RepID=A0ABV5EZC2_9FLAO
MNELQTDSLLSDENLVAEIVRTKSSELFSVVYDRYSEIIYNKCLSFVKNNEEAQDLTHDIFVKLFVKIKTFNNQSKFSTWLYSFTYNHCVSYLQRDLNKRKKKILFTDDENQLDYLHDEIDDEQIFNLDYENFEKAIDLIDPNDKILLFMKYQDDMTIEEIELALNLGKSAVKMRLSRAKSKLIKIYNQL